MEKRIPFGGIPFVGIGDFRQVAPVVKGGGRTATRLASIQSSPLWGKFTILRLHSPIRSAQDPQYTAFVDDIGENYMEDHCTLSMLERLPSVEHCIDFLFPTTVLANPLASLKRAFLSPKNSFVDEFNAKVLERLPGEQRASLLLPVTRLFPFL
jgi:hypothetical protein